jgi:hypothetical protein
MGTTLTGTTPATTYDSLIKVTDNGPLSGTAKYLSDGLGNDSVLALSTAAAGIGTTTIVSGTKLTVGGPLAAVGSAGTMGTFETSASACFIGLKDASGSLVYLGGDDGNFLIQTPSSSYSTKLTLTDAGNVGIGTSSPTDTIGYGRALDIQSSTGAVVYLRDSNAPTTQYGFLAFDGTDNGLKLQNANSSGFLRFDTNGTERMRITSAGDVGIGTSSPLLNLSVVGVSGAESASATPNGSISIGPTGSNNQILTLGFLNGAGNHTWLQSRNSNQALFYPLILNPSGGNVGIGKTNPTALRPDAAGSVACAFEVSGNGSAGIRITDSSAVNRYLDISVDDNVAEIGAYYSTTPTLNLNAYGSINFKRQNTTIATITANGLTFNGDTSSNNALSDYEIGTWTPTLGGTWSTNPTGLTGQYTKIGNMVYIRLDFTGGVKATNVSGWFDGLPFSGAVGGGGTVSNVSVEDKGIVLLDNSTRVWTTVNDFGGLGTKVMASYRV